MFYFCIKGPLLWFNHFCAIEMFLLAKFGHFRLDSRYKSCFRGWFNNAPDPIRLSEGFRPTFCIVEDKFQLMILGISWLHYAISSMAKKSFGRRVTYPFFWLPDLLTPWIVPSFKDFAGAVFSHFQHGIMWPQPAVT